MAQIGHFDANDVAPSAPMEVMPRHWATVLITESESKPTGGGAGSMLVLTTTIQGGTYANRKLWINLNLVNSSQQAVDIAYSDLSAICRATGVMVIEDSQQLHGFPFDMLIDVEAATYHLDPQTKQPIRDPQTGEPLIKYEAKNIPKGFAPAGEKAGTDPVAGAVPAAGAAPVVPAAVVPNAAPVAAAPTPAAKVPAAIPAAIPASVPAAAPVANVPAQTTPTIPAAIAPAADAVPPAAVAATTPAAAQAAAETVAAPIAVQPAAAPATVAQPAAPASSVPAQEAAPLAPGTAEAPPWAAG